MLSGNETYVKRIYIWITNTFLSSDHWANEYHTPIWPQDCLRRMRRFDVTY